MFTIMKTKNIHSKRITINEILLLEFLKKYPRYKYLRIQYQYIFLGIKKRCFL